MSLLPNPGDPIPLSDAAEYAHQSLTRGIVRMHREAMKTAENAIDAMVYLARLLDDHGKRDPGSVHRAMDAAGMTALDRRCLCRLLEIADWPLYSKLASGCLQIGSMANARKETP